MKRQQIVNNLLREGFRSQTLASLSDSQLLSLHRKVMKEDVMVSKKDPQYNQKITNAKKENKTIETYESKSKKPKGLVNKKSNKKSTTLKTSKKSPMKISENTVLNSKMKRWVEKLVENKMSDNNVASKSEIMDLIRKKLNEDKTKTNLPSFMSFDSIVGTETKPAPAQPKVDPDRRTEPERKRRRDPWDPERSIQTKPKATETKPAPAQPKVDPDRRTEPERKRRRDPWDPERSIQTKPKATETKPAPAQPKVDPDRRTEPERKRRRDPWDPERSIQTKPKAKY